MKILYISTEEIGAAHGGGVHTWETARHLARRGHAICVVAPEREGLPAREIREQVEILRRPMRFLDRSFPARLLVEWGLRSINCDVILSRWSALGGAEPLLARRLGVPWVIEINNPHAHEIVGRSRLPGFLARALLARSERLMARARGAVTSNARIAPADVPVLEIPWGVDTDRFHPRLRADGTREAVRRGMGLGNRPAVLFTGTFRPWHGVHHVPAIAERVLADVPDAVFLLAGSGEMSERVREEIVRKGLAGSIRLLGSLPYARIPALCAAADVGIAPFAPEENPLFARFGFYYSPLKIFEYMAAALPVATFAIPPLDAIVEGAGAAAPPGNLAALARGIASLLADPARARETGARARAKAERLYGWDVHAEKLEKFLRSIAPRGAARSGPSR